MGESDLHQLTRQELYEKVWESPGIRLAEEFGVSDVAIAKRCRKLSVPRPPPGYWAKIAAGHRIKRPALPPSPEELLKALNRPLSRKLIIPNSPSNLHPVAEEFLHAVQKSKEHSDGLVWLDEPALPKAQISKAAAWRATQSIHAIVKELESRGLPYRHSRRSSGGGYFVNGQDRLFLKITETLVSEPSATRTQGRRYQTVTRNKVPSGSLLFVIESDDYCQRTSEQWIDDGKGSPRAMASKIILFTCAYHRELNERREQEAISDEKERRELEELWRKEQEEERIRQRDVAIRRHLESLNTVKQLRLDDLRRAAQWWQVSQSITEFVTVCEQRWLDTQANELNAEQAKWLSWARETAKATAPFESGYPDPLIDGQFDPTTVPFGGPYPGTRNFPSVLAKDADDSGPREGQEEPSNSTPDYSQNWTSPYHSEGNHRSWKSHWQRPKT
ncbi:MAG: hypothetical protein R3F07_11930 [Opitutaceae bacterium]